MNVSYSYKQIGKIAYPIFLTLLVQNLIQVIDTAYLGRVGKVELGASAIAGIYYVVIFMLAFGFSTGSQILIARRNGEGKQDRIGEIVLQGTVFLLLMGLGLFMFTFLFSESILTNILKSADVRNAALKYLDWRMYGLFFSSVNVMFRAFYVGTTRTKILSVNALIMGLTNVFFDYVLIFGHWGFPEMGIAGAALASVISEAVSVVFFFIYTGKYINLGSYGFTKKAFSNFRTLVSILSISISLMLQFFLSLGTWFYFFLAIEHRGEESLAISNIVRSVYMIISIPIFALGTTTNTIISNTIGNGKKEEVIPLVWKILKIALAISAVVMLIMALFPELPLHIYTSDKELIHASVPSLYIILSALPFISFSNVFFNAVSGTGNTRTALILEILTLILYVAYMWLIIRFLKVPLALCWTSEHIYAFFMFLFSYIYIKKGNWQNKQI